MKWRGLLFSALALVALVVCGFTGSPKRAFSPPAAYQDSLKKAKGDSLRIHAGTQLKLHKRGAHASYYAERFNGRRTASGKRFDNSKYTAAHRKFPFGTKLKITNEANGKSVFVEVTDRGPFTRGRDIDLTKKAFMEIAGSKYGGSLKVTIEQLIK